MGPREILYLKSWLKFIVLSIELEAKFEFLKKKDIVFNVNCKFEFYMANFAFKVILSRISIYNHCIWSKIWNLFIKHSIQGPR